jgi:signal transduction histidine kinase/ligand-binding sensor domain-containing protein
LVSWWIAWFSFEYKLDCLRNKPPKNGVFRFFLGGGSRNRFILDSMQPVTKRPFAWFVLFACLLLPSLASADTNDSAAQDYVVKVWGADDGLTENSVTDVAQTPEGYLWIGTLFGSVLRFDGTHFVMYNSANTPEFSLKWGVPRLMVDQAGTLWISMFDGGITSWDQDGFHSGFVSTNQPARLLWSAPGRVVFAYGDGRLLSGQKSNGQWNWQVVSLPNISSQPYQCSDASGQIWYLQNENKIGMWNGVKTQTLANAPGLDNAAIRVMTADGQGNIWVGTDTGLAMWQTDHFVIMTPANGEATLNVKRIIPSGGRSLWVEANGRMRRCLGRKWVAESFGWNSELAKRTSLRFLHGDNEGGLWSGVGDLGLIHVAPNGAFQRLTTQDGLPSNVVHFAYEDRDGNIWTGYDRGGLVQVRRRLFKVIGKNQGLDDSLINTVTEDAQGAVWIGTHSGVVGCYADGVCTNITLPGPARTQDSCVTADQRGRIWIGAQGVGLLMREDGQMRQVATETQLQAYPRLLLPGKDGSLWVGTLWSIICVSNENLSFKYTSQSVGGHPTALAEAADGTIWAGTLDGFLLHWNGTQFVPLEPPDRASLGRIWALWPAPDGSIWAGTEEGGLLHWTKGRFYHYTTKNGLPSDSVAQVLGDAAGNLWLGTRTGIVRIHAADLARFEGGDAADLPVSIYGQPEGLLTIGSAIIYQPNCWQGRGGTLFFAMANSIAAVQSASAHINVTPPIVALEELRADDKPLWPARTGAVVTAPETPQNNPPAAPEIKVAPGHGDLEFQYTGLQLSSLGSFRFKYRLEGLENAWNEAGDERKAIYRHLAPGRYVFHVMACNSDSIWSADNALIAVTVNPFFYQTAWFRLVVGLSVVTGLSLAAAFLMRVRMRHRVEQLERQHELERERSRIAQDLHDELGAGLTEIGLLGGLLKDPSRLPARNHEALDRIVQRCHDLVMTLDEIVWAMNSRNDSVNSLAGYLCHYAQNFLEPTTIRCRLEMQETEPDQPLNSEQRHNLFLAFEEALTNVVRHSGASEVHIKISSAEMGYLSVGIEDNGRGLPAVMVTDGADGLNNLRKRMSQIGGSCDITSQPGGGVSVRLTLRLAARQKNDAIAK